MADNTFELPPTPPTTPSGPAIDPSSTAVPAAPRPTAPAPPSTTSSPWHPHFELPSAAPAGPAAGRAAPAGARRAAVTNRTRVIVGGASVASFLAILAAVGLHGGSQPASNVNTTTNGDSLQTEPFGSSDNPFSRRFSGGFSATPGSGSGSPNTRSHGS